MNLFNKKSLLSIWLIIIAISMNAQRPGGGERPNLTFEGQILDQSSNVPLEFATISFFVLRDSSLAGGGLTDTEGKFSIEMPAGQYFATAEYIGFQPMSFPITMDREAVRAAGGKVDLGQIKLATDAQMLDEVEVRAEISETQFSLDKKVFNVGKDLANRGGSAEDILDNVPSVAVDIEGNVSLRGSEGVRILIDGKPSGLAGSALKSLPANLIDQVEVITNPSARYEAEGSSGIINIILKKDKRGGFNGAIDGQVGVPEQYGVGANLNYRKGPLNWFLNYGIRKRTGPGGGNNYQERYFDNAPTTITDQTRDINRSGINNSVRFGADYFFNDKEFLTGAFSYRVGDDDNLSTVTYLDYLGSTENLISNSVRTDNENETDTNLNYDLSYRKEYTNRDHRLDISFQYRDDSEEESSLFLEEINNINAPNETLNQRSANKEGQENMVFQVDFKKPLKGKDHKFEVGIRSGLRTINNNYKVEDLVDGNWEEIASLTNNFNYNEDIHALYTQYGNRYGDFSIQVGLRGEYADISTELIQTGEQNSRDNLRVFPSIFLNYELSEGNALQLSYSSRIRRPRFRDLNPFFTFSDNRNFYSGNPNLTPELSDSYEVGYLRIWDKATINASLFYRYTSDKISRFREVFADGTTLLRPENFATEENLGLDVNFSYNGIKGLRVSGNANFFNNKVDATSLAPNLTSDAFTWFGRMTARYSFWENADMQLRLNHRGARVTPQGESDPITSVDFGMSKDVFKRNGTLTLSVRDVFNSRKRSGITVGEDFFVRSDFQWRARSANLSFTYRINQKKSRRGNGERSGGGGGDFEGGEF